MANIDDRWTSPSPDGGRSPNKRHGHGLRWRARYYDAGGKQHSQQFPRRVDAQQWLDSVTTAVGTGSYVDPARSKALVRVVADEWLAGKINLKETTRVRYKNALYVHVLPRWGDTPLVAVEHSAIQAWLAELSASGQAGASVRKIHGVLSAILDLAVRDKRLPSNPANGVNLPRAKSRRRRYLTADQVEWLAAEASRPPATRTGSPFEAAYGAYGLAIYVLAYCGLRWSELAGLRVERIDLVRGRINITEAVTELDGGRLVWGEPKSYENRTVPIPRFLRDDLALHVAGRSAKDLLFTTVNGDVLRNRNARRSWFDPAAAAIGEPGLTPHELRHTAASLAVSAGANVKAVQRLLGHASAAMTLDVYADLFDSDLDAVANRLDETRATARERVQASGKVIALR